MNTNTMKSKAVKSLHNESKFMFALYLIGVIKLKDCILHHETYNYGVTARFVPNTSNALTYIIFAIYFVVIILYHTTVNVKYEFRKINKGLITYFE